MIIWQHFWLADPAIKVETPALWGLQIGVPKFRIPRLLVGSRLPVAPSCTWGGNGAGICVLMAHLHVTPLNAGNLRCNFAAHDLNQRNPGEGRWGQKNIQTPNPKKKFNPSKGEEFILTKCIFMSPDSPVFHTVESVKFTYNSKVAKLPVQIIFMCYYSQLDDGHAW